MIRIVTPWGNVEIPEPKFSCYECGNQTPMFRPLASNKSIQMRCDKCGAFHSNVKYDPRSRKQIAKDERARRWKEKQDAGVSQGL